jgi:hypothetical protein
MCLTEPVREQWTWQVAVIGFGERCNKYSDSTQTRIFFTSSVSVNAGPCHSLSG